MYAKKVAVNQQIFLELNYYKVTTSSNIYVPLNSSIPPPPRLTPRNTLEIAQTKWKKEKTTTIFSLAPHPYPVPSCPCEESFVQDVSTGSSQRISSEQALNARIY